MTRRFVASMGAAGVVVFALGIAALVLAAGTDSPLAILEFLLGISFTISGAVLIVAVYIAWRDRNWISSEGGNGKGPDS